MALFPTFIDIKNQAILIIGGGNIALHKINKLLPFSPEIHVIADRINDDIQLMAEQNQLTIEERKYEDGDIKENYKMVIVAADDIDLQKELYFYCEGKRMLYNCVDVPEYCNFIFPSLVVGEHLTIGISTSGKAPSVSARIRQLLEQALPEDIEAVIEEIDRYRNTMEKGEERMKKVIDKTNELLPLN